MNILAARLARHVAVAWTIFALVTLTTSPIDAQSPGEGDSTRSLVLVSRREIRIVFAPETASTWGWPARTNPDYPQRYYWSATIEGTDGPMTFGVHVAGQDGIARTFPTLDSLVRSGKTSLCQPGMVARCFPAEVISSVDGRRVVLSYRDSAAIDRMFGTRPSSATTVIDRPRTGGLPALDNAAILYVEPQLARVGDAERLEALRARRSFDASVNRVYRGIGGGTHTSVLWLAVGDSAELGIREMHCLEDSCSPYHDLNNGPRDWGRWSLTDSSVARLHRTRTPRAIWEFLADSERVMVLVGKRAGRTTVRAVGVHTSADTVPSRTPVDTILERQVMVTPRIGRLRITPRPATLVAGDSIRFVVHVLDRSGRPLKDTPVTLAWGTGTYMSVLPASGPVDVTFPSAGRFTVVATLGQHTDTLSVDVVAAPH